MESAPASSRPRDVGHSWTRPVYAVLVGRHSENLRRKPSAQQSVLPASIGIYEEDDHVEY